MMDDLFLVVVLICILALVIGMIKPGIVVRWGDVSKRKRGKVFKVYGILMVVCFVGFGMTTEGPSEQLAEQPVLEHAFTDENTVNEVIGVETSTEEPSDPVVESVVTEPISTDDETPHTFEDEVIAVIGDTIKVNSIYLDEYAKDLSITVEMSDNITKNMTKLGMEKAASHIFKNVFPLLLSREDIDMITYSSETIFVDKYGNERKDTACLISMNKETYNKINWDNFLTDNLKDVATSYYLHPIFN